MGDNGPGMVRIKEKLVRYDRLAMAEAAFLSAHQHHQLVERGTDWFHFTRTGDLTTMSPATK
jgi:hypothetical protein